ncbi:MAG: YetF domain-containing protein, partial [Salinibacter sp.]|uniref:YetF domain-containing protein n=1 Tax=Salinibacter sp. TaxID=2065818 RepID=UPI0035D4EC4F
PGTPTINGPWIRGAKDTLLLFLDGPEVLSDNLRPRNMTEADLRAKLHEANVTRLEQVRAVVMESTGDVPVLGSYALTNQNSARP